MPKVQAWQCKYTGKLFEIDNLSGYRLHLAQLARERKREKALAIAKAEYDDWFRTSRAGLNSVSEILEWFSQNVRRIAEYRLGYKVDKLFEVYNIRSGSVINYNKMVSNTHSAPHGKETNWGGKEGKPRGYPGLRCNVAFDTRGKCPVTFISELLEYANIRPDCGGSGSSTDYQYGMTFWIEDWPGLQKDIDQQKNNWRKAVKIYNIQHTKDAIIAKLKGVSHDYNPPLLKITSH